MEDTASPAEDLESPPPLVARVVEPDDALRAALEALVHGATEAMVPRAVPARLVREHDPVQVAVLGPGAPLEQLASLREEGLASVVLAAPSDGARLVAALQTGADDAMLWPGRSDELIGRARLAAGRARTAHALSVERRDLMALLELSEALSNIVDIEGTLHQIARRMAEVMRSERCSIILVDDEGKQGVVVADSADATVRNHPIPVETSYPEIVAVTRSAAPLVIDDVRSAPLFDEVREIIRDKPVGNTALFPVRLGGRVQGVIMCRGADVRTAGVSERQIRFGTIVGNATAIAVRNARMVQSIRERTERVLSARIRAERRLRQLEKYQRFFDLAGDGLAIVDGRGRILFANRAARQMLGFTADDVTQIRLGDIATGASLDTLDRLLDSLRAGRHGERVDLEVIRADGARAVLSLSTGSLDPELERSTAELGAGRFADVAAIISMRDVTDTRRIQDELQKTKEFLENVIQSSADAIVAANMSGTIMIFNRGAERITGHRSEDVVGKMSVARLYPDGVAQEIMRRLRSDRHGGPGRYEAGRHELLTVGGELVPISLAAALVLDGGKAIASVGIFSDLREQIRMEEALAHAQRKLEITERQAAIIELAGTAAHELSQPLTTIVGSAELMVRRLPPDDPNLRSVERILTQGDRMAEILAKLATMKQYQTKPYVGSTNILDLDASGDTENQA
jgi:PAS domain S-box-containing protein